MIDFTKLKRLERDDMVSYKTHTPISIRISDKQVLMMMRELMDVLPDKTSADEIVESMIVHVYKQLRKEGKV
jgi:hypothetical protein